MNKEEYIKKFGIEAYNEHPSKKGKAPTKYSVCSNHVLKYAWEFLEPKLKEDFGIEMRYEMRRIPKFNKNYGMVILYKDGNELGQLSCPCLNFGTSRTVKIGTHFYCMHKLGRYYVRFKEYVYIDLFDTDKQSVFNALNNVYLDKIWTGIIEMQNEHLLNESNRLKYEDQESNLSVGNISNVVFNDMPELEDINVFED